MRNAPLFLIAAAAVVSCDSPKEGGGDASASAAAAKPDIQLVVRTVSVQKTVTGPPPARGADPESWTALEGKVYTVVTADLVHNACAAGDKLDAGLASLVLPDGSKAELAGGGADKDHLCVLCQPSDKLSCSGGQAGMRPYTFVFAAPEKADIAKATLHYKKAKSALSDGKLTDRRGNDKLNAEIAAKKQELAAMKKKLENTGSVTDGKILLGEMDALKKEIEKLENQQK